MKNVGNLGITYAQGTVQAMIMYEVSKSNTKIGMYLSVFT